MKLICRVCKYEIATISKDTRIPVKGAMFHSKDPKHGFPPPWSPVVEWQYMYCPLCKKRPFLDPADGGNIFIDTDEGRKIITPKGVESVKTIDITRNGFLGTVEIVPGPLPLLKEKAEAAPEPLADIEAPAGLVEDNGDPTPVDDIPAESNDMAEEHSPLSEHYNYEGDPNKSFEERLRSGEIIQRGSWYEYKGKNFRRTELEEKLNG